MNVGSATSYSNVASTRPQRPQGPPPSPEDFAAKLLEDLDTDTDGALSADEISAADDPRLQELFKAADADGDGLDGGTEIDLASLLESSSRGISAYQSNSLWSNLFESHSSLDLAG